MTESFTFTRTLTSDEIAELPAFASRYAPIGSVGGGTDVEVDDDETLAADSATVVPSQRAVKAFVTAQIAAIPDNPPPPPPPPTDSSTVVSHQQNSTAGVPGGPFLGQTTISVGTGRSVLTPWATDVPVAIRKVSTNVTVAAVAGARARLALYRKVTPDAVEQLDLVADFGTIPVDTVGPMSITLATPLELEPGVYCTCLIADADGATYGCMTMLPVGFTVSGALVVSNNLRPYQYAQVTINQASEVAAGAATTKAFQMNTGAAAGGGIAQVAYFDFFA